MQEREAPVIIYESINGAKWDCEPRDEKRVRRKRASGVEGAAAAGDAECDPPDVV